LKGIVERLSRRLPGEHQIGLTELVADLGGRLDRKVLEPRLKEPRKARSGKTRKLHPGARPEPNAPQLIRLVRTPYQEHPGHPKRQQLIEKRQPIARAERLADLLGVVERPRLSFKSPAEDRPIPVAPRPRLWRRE